MDCERGDRETVEQRTGRKKRTKNGELCGKFSYEGAARVCVCVVCTYVSYLRARAFTDGRIFGWTLIADGSIS